MSRPRHVLIAAVIALLAVSVAIPAASASSDLNGDGRDDLVIASPNETVGRESGAGVVNILLGRRAGLKARGDRMWSQADFGGTVEARDRFGVAIAYGDFDADGYDDAAHGRPRRGLAWQGASRGRPPGLRVQAGPARPRRRTHITVGQDGRCQRRR